VSRSGGDQPIDPHQNASSPSGVERRARPRGSTVPRRPYATNHTRPPDHDACALDSCGAATRAAGRHPTTRALRGQAATGSMEPALQSCC
jgi:hypothetical protein